MIQLYLSHHLHLQSSIAIESPAIIQRLPLINFFFRTHYVFAVCLFQLDMFFICDLVCSRYAHAFNLLPSKRGVITGKKSINQ